MIPEILEPQSQLLREEYVLVQAWKKAARYIRYHNWYSDTLALDRAATDLPFLLEELVERLQAGTTWQNDPLRIVPAPKAQRWAIDPANGRWEPVKSESTPSRLRPLAHVSIPDQVVTTAIMLCLADRVENLQGDPRGSVLDQRNRRRVVSYGNRLFCYPTSGPLRHAWGSVKLYRAYFQDYRAFLSRPEAVAAPLASEAGSMIFVVHADLRQFYDRVRPALLASALQRIRMPEDDPAFFELGESALNWSWDSRDEREVASYSQQAGLGDFSRVALPQGLVASGFLSNIVLLGFDGRLKEAIGTEVGPGILLVDACRYVDDLRLTIALGGSEVASADDVRQASCAFLERILNEEARGLALAGEKTQVVSVGGDVRPAVRQSARMSRIQTAVSGGFDVLGGEAILDGIQGLMSVQGDLNRAEDSAWRMSPVPDVPSGTVARFAAVRYRTTVRSLRPLLESGFSDDDADLDGSQTFGEQAARTQRDLDEDTRTFALDLIQRWVQDPSNVRLLRIGLELWPDAEVLLEVLGLLTPFTETGGQRKAPRRIAWYCLSEILRAGATETGLVPDAECLPDGVDLQAYRKLLREEATRLLRLPAQRLPWYLRQQALLFLAAVAPADAPFVLTGSSPETKHYRQLIRFLRGDNLPLESRDFATVAVLARRSFADRQRAFELARPRLTPVRIQQIALKDPSFLMELLDARTPLLEGLTPRIREDLWGSRSRLEVQRDTLAELVVAEHPHGLLRNELSVLRLAGVFLREWRRHVPRPEVVVPSQIELEVSDRQGIAAIDNLRILRSRVSPSDSMYRPPAWCEESHRWRFHVGFLLRFVLSGQADYTRPVRSAHWKERESAYRAAESHWYQRLYGLFSGQPAFGDDWLPITDWLELFLLALLRWPGCPMPYGFDWVDEGIDRALGKV